MNIFKKSNTKVPKIDSLNNKQKSIYIHEKPTSIPKKLFHFIVIDENGNHLPPEEILCNIDINTEQALVMLKETLGKDISMKIEIEGMRFLLGSIKIISNAK